MAYPGDVCVYIVYLQYINILSFIYILLTHNLIGSAEIEKEWNGKILDLDSGAGFDSMYYFQIHFNNIWEKWIAMCHRNIIKNIKNHNNIILWPKYHDGIISSPLLQFASLLHNHQVVNPVSVLSQPINMVLVISVRPAQAKFWQKPPTPPLQYLDNASYAMARWSHYGA